MRRHTGRPQTLEQSLGEGSSGEGNGVEGLQGLLEAGIHRQVGRDHPWIDWSVLAACQTMCKQARVAEPSGQRLPGESGELAECRYPQPAEGVDQLLTVDRLAEGFQVQSGEETDGVRHQMGITRIGGRRRPSGGKGPFGHTDQRLPTAGMPGHAAHLLGDPLGQGDLSPIEANRPGDGDEDQSGGHHLHPWDEPLDGLDHRLEASRLLPGVPDQDGGEGGQCLCLASRHSQTDAGSEDIFGRTGDPIVDDQYRFIRRRVGSPQRPHRKPHAQCATLHPPPRIAG